MHAAGCSHYDSPEEGVRPEDMWRQALGEDLNVASVLTWAPGWYHQKSFFTGKDDPLSTQKNIMRYDVEVSGFPSSHAGHLVLLRLKEDDYPGTTQIEEWPSWTLPVLTWAKSQGGVTGYAHSGWGLAPMQPTSELPNYIVPKMDYIGANEYIVTAALNAVDFYSAGDTPVPWELNMWYHTLNCGFKIPLSGETDFPCITDERIGQARTYFIQQMLLPGFPNNSLRCLPALKKDLLPKRLTGILREHGSADHAYQSGKTSHSQPRACPYAAISSACLSQPFSFILPAMSLHS